RGGREALPFPYSDEVWTGIEYHVAAGLIFEGLVEEGLAVVAAARARYAGHNRNPFNEVECGHHYARAMSSWGVLIALSGFDCDAASERLAFAPRLNRPDFRTFYSTGASWGTFRLRRARAATTAELNVAFGRQSLRTLGLPVRAKRVEVMKQGGPLPAAITKSAAGCQIVFDPPVMIDAGETLMLRLS
ncbi:MAG: GH116 family glycosyl hydrolase, partial [Phycisphaerae bacterium]|nr:GH116 family glycosyl hydrolase [Phycisphaerae bacterium]